MEILQFSFTCAPPHSVFHGKFHGDVKTHLYFYCEIALQLVMIGGSLKCEVSTQILLFLYCAIYIIFLVVLC